MNKDEQRRQGERVGHGTGKRAGSWERKLASPVREREGGIGGVNRVTWYHTCISQK